MKISINLVYTVSFLCCIGNLHCQTTVVLDPSSTTVEDAVIGSIVPDNNYGKIEDLHVYNWTQQGILNTVRALIGFQIPDSLKADVKISEAKLMLYFNKTSIYNDEHAGDNGFYVERITSDWDQESVTWNSQPTTTSNNRIEMSSSIDPHQNYEIDVTSLVIDMQEDPKRSFGFMLKHVDELPYKMNLFASSDHPIVELHPKLTLKYNCDLEQLINVCPNPAKLDVNLCYPNKIVIEKIKVIDSIGRQINQVKGNDIDELRIYTKGFYVLEIFTNKGKVLKKVIVN